MTDLMFSDDPSLHGWRHRGARLGALAVATHLREIGVRGRMTAVSGSSFLGLRKARVQVDTDDGWYLVTGESTWSGLIDGPALEVAHGGSISTSIGSGPGVFLNAVAATTARRVWAEVGPAGSRLVHADTSWPTLRLWTSGPSGHVLTQVERRGGVVRRMEKLNSSGAPSEVLHPDSARDLADAPALDAFTRLLAVRCQELAGLDLGAKDMADLYRG